jgi:hypothetical protein
MGGDPELEALLRWNPPTLSLAVDASKSKHFRAPSFYDKHLVDSLILKEVVFLPSLHHDIAGVVDITLSLIRDKGIQLPQTQSIDTFPVTQQREENDYYENQPMKNEMSVAHFYLKTTAQYCMPVASTLALHPSAPRWLRSLEWHPVPSKSGCAIADGVLRILPSLKEVLSGKREATGFEKVLVDSMRENCDDERWKGLVEVVKRLPDVMTMEIKSLSVATEDIMHSVKHLSGSKFPWVTCTGEECERHESTYGPNDYLIDAATTPWSIPATPTIFSEGRDDGGDDDDYIPQTDESLTAQKFLQQVFLYILFCNRVKINILFSPGPKLCAPIPPSSPCMPVHSSISAFVTVPNNDFTFPT